MDTGYPAFIPEPEKHVVKTFKPDKPGKSQSNSKGELPEDQQSDDKEGRVLQGSNSSPRSKSVLLKKIFPP